MLQNYIRKPLLKRTKKTAVPVIGRAENKNHGLKKELFKFSPYNVNNSGCY